MKTNMHTIRTLLATLLLAPLAALHAADKLKPESKPNIIVILADDMGFSDLGCYGSEIPTPHLDALAANGLKFTQFYNMARCCPSRATLLTGLYSHQTGVGGMMAKTDSPGYQGRLNDKCVTIPEVLQTAGYFTILSGKWHLGGMTGENKNDGPVDRGFDRCLFAPSGGFYYSKGPKGKSGLNLNGKNMDADVAPFPPNWYSTDLWTSYSLKFIDEAVASKKPFYLHLCYNAPHWPLQAPEEEVAAFRGKYKDGWSKIREARYAKQVELGLVDPSAPLPPRPENIPSWQELSPKDQDQLDHLMATYAATIVHMDKSIGELVSGLEKRGILDNTIILFMSDNGGCAEGGPKGAAKGNPTDPLSRWLYGMGWAWVSNTPFRMYKHFDHEGGISSPLIVSWPAGIKARGELRKEPCHLMDMMPTCVELAGASYPQEFKGKPIFPMEGKSLAGVFQQKELTREQFCWEHEGNAAIRMGNFKLVRLGYQGKWELYDIKKDRTESKDLSSSMPEKVKEMDAQWNVWAQRAQVLPYPPNNPKKEKKGGEGV